MAKDLYGTELQEELKKRGTRIIAHQGMGEPAHRISSKDFMSKLITSDYAIEALGFDIERVPEDRSANGSLWKVRYFFYPDSVYAAAYWYTTKKHAKKGDSWIKQRDGQGAVEWGYVVRFYRVGCVHPNLKRRTIRMHEHEVYCPDCGYRQVFDSSG